MLIQTRKKQYVNILVYDISYKTLIGAKPLCSRFDKIEDSSEIIMKLDI